MVGAWSVTPALPVSIVPLLVAARLRRFLSVMPPLESVVGIVGASGVLGAAFGPLELHMVMSSGVQIWYVFSTVYTIVYISASGS